MFSLEQTVPAKAISLRSLGYSTRWSSRDFSSLCDNREEPTRFFTLTKRIQIKSPFTSLLVKMAMTALGCLQRMTGSFSLMRDVCFLKGSGPHNTQTLSAQDTRRANFPNSQKKIATPVFQITYITIS